MSQASDATGRAALPGSGKSSAGVQPLSLRTLIEVTSYESETKKITAFDGNVVEARVLKQSPALQALRVDTGDDDTCTSLACMLEEGENTAPANTPIAVAEEDKITSEDRQNLSDILLLSGFISVNAAKIANDRRGGKPYNVTTEEGANEYVEDMANSLVEVTNQSMAGFLIPRSSTASFFEKNVTTAELHTEVLGFIFGGLSLPAKALKALDSLLTGVTSKLSASLSSVKNTLKHCIFLYSFEEVEGFPGLKLPSIRLFFVQVSNQSWELVVGKSSIKSLTLKMQLSDNSWSMNPELVRKHREQIGDIVSQMAGNNLEDTLKLTSPEFIDISP